MPFDEYQFLRYFIPGSLFVIYATCLILPILSTDGLLFMGNHLDIAVAIAVGAFGAALAFGYVIYTFYDTFSYGRDAMKKEQRPLLRYFANHAENWNNLSESRQKMFIEMTHITGKDIVDCRYFYSIGRGFRSHYNARIVCSLYVPAAALAIILFFVLSSYFTGNTYLSLTSRHAWLDIPILGVIFIVSVVLHYGATRPRNEAAQLEYLFIRRRVETDPDFSKACAIAGVNWSVVANEENYDFEK